MSDGSNVQSYFRAKDQLDGARSTLARLAQELRQIAAFLSGDPVRVIPQKQGETFARRHPPMSENAPRLVAEEWPTWERMRQALTDYYNAEEQLYNAERSLSADDRRHLGLR